MDIWDCIVVGGGAAGLSAALVLGRARRSTLVIDAGAPSNLSAHGIGGLLGHDGRPPAELYAMGRAELGAYPSVELRDSTVVGGSRTGAHFDLQLADGRRERARRVLLATGMDYRPPDLPGVAPLWGRSVFHCPFCHGWEVRDQPLAVLARGERAVHVSLLLRGWSDDIVLLTDGPPELEAADVATLSGAGVAIDERRVVGLAAVDGRLSAVEFAQGPPLARTGLLVGAPLHQRSGLAADLGAGTSPPSQIAVDALEVGPRGTTGVPGLFAAGDLSGQVSQVAWAIASGSLAAVSVVQSLTAEEFGLPQP